MKNLVTLFALFFLLIMSCTDKTGKTPVASVTTAQSQKLILKGYLMDKQCGVKETAMDGTDIRLSPFKHTRHCLEVCAFSGYGMMLLNTNTSQYGFILFDEKGHELAREYIKSSSSKDFAVEVSGIKEGDILKVSELRGI